MVEILKVIVLACQVNTGNKNYEFIKKDQLECQKKLIRCVQTKRLVRCLKERK